MEEKTSNIVKPKLKVSSSVGNFEEKVLNAWKLEKWTGWDDPVKDIIFFGMYHQHDWLCFWHLGEDVKRTIFWCGGDVLRVVKNPEWQRILKLFKVDHYCETEQEAELLGSIGIEVKIIPSFVEEVPNVSYAYSDNPNVWLCCHEKREKEYGVDIMWRMAKKFPDYNFHVYGGTDKVELEEITKGEVLPNVYFHGNVDNEKFNKEIQKYQCGLRCNEADGMSEVPLKSLFMGQYPITRMKFPYMWNYKDDETLEEQLKELKFMYKPNFEGRTYWIKRINQFPWCEKQFYESDK